jgi:hypothetical protein
VLAFKCILANAKVVGERERKMLVAYGVLTNFNDF